MTEPKIVLRMPPTVEAARYLLDHGLGKLHANAAVGALTVLAEDLLTKNAGLRTRLAQVEQERDQAIAHDRQPYPTADAFEAVCRALEKHRDIADRATAALERSSLNVDEAEKLRREFEARIPDQPEAGSLANRLTVVEAERDAMRPVVEAARRIHDAAEQQTETIQSLNFMARTREVDRDLRIYHSICSMLHEPLGVLDSYTQSSTPGETP